MGFGLFILCLRERGPREVSDPLRVVWAGDRVRQTLHRHHSPRDRNRLVSNSSNAAA